MRNKATVYASADLMYKLSEYMHIGENTVIKTDTNTDFTVH